MALKELAKTFRGLTYTEMQDLASGIAEEIRSNMAYGEEEVSDERVATAFLGWATLTLDDSDDD